MDQQHGDSESTCQLNTEKNTKWFSKCQSSVYLGKHNFSWNRKNLILILQVCACAFRITRKLHLVFRTQRSAGPWGFPHFCPLAVPPNCPSSAANCPVTTPSWGKHVSTYPPLVPWNDPLAILLYGLTSNHSSSRPYSCRVPFGDPQFYLPCHSTSARVALLSTSLHQVCYKEANIPQCHRNLLAHKDCAYSNQGPKYNPGRIRLRRFSLGLPVWQPHLRWFAPHVLAQFSSSPLLVRQTIGWPIGDLPVQLAGPHAGQGRKALWRNLCLPHSIFQYISYLSWLRTKKSLLTVSSPTKRKRLTSPFHRLRFTGTRFCKRFWKALDIRKRDEHLSSINKNRFGGVFQREGSHTQHYCWTKSSTCWDYWNNAITENS